MAGVKSLNVGNPGGPGGGSDLNFEFSGKDVEQLRMVAQELQSFLEQYDGVSDINDSFSQGSDEIQINIRPEGEALGLSLASLAQQVRYGFYGAEAQRMQRDDEEIKVMVRYPKERSSIGHLETMRVRTNNGEEIPFAQVADIDIGKGYASINRVDGKRSVSVIAKVNPDIIEPNTIVSDLMTKAIPDYLKRYPGVEFKLQGNTKEQGDAAGVAITRVLFALFAIYALMAIPLKSYSQPLIIMSVIPFGMVGAIIGHLVLGQAVSVLSICGIIALSGVVVNDSLIMVDFVNRARKEGASLIEAAIRGWRTTF